MKRCPKCNQEFTDDWLTFCTQDGTSLIDEQGEFGEPAPTLIHPSNPSLPPSVSPSEQPTLDMPGPYTPPAPYVPPAPLQPSWRPPPPPPFPTGKQQSLAVTSFVLGLFSMTLGWCCSFGVLTAPIALVLGIVALVQIKNDPAKFGGKGFAIGGVISGALYFLIFAANVFLYGIGILLGGLN